MNVTVETPRPSPAEALRGEYGEEWDIYREVLPAGRHGDWIAERLTEGAPDKIRAATVGQLAEQLRGAGS